MRDRQLFEQSTLPNGIKVFQYRDETPYTHIILRVPVGSSNSTGTIAPGTFHFLEHMCMLRSKRHPTEKEFDRLVGLKGGELHATTSPFDTTYQLQVHTKHLSALLPGFFSHVFEPVFYEKDITRERGVIASERRRKERWFPSKSEVGQYIRIRWMWDCSLSLRQRVGSDEDLALMTPESLATAHQHYFLPRTWVLVGGSGDISVLLDLLASLTLAAPDPPHVFEPLHWVTREYHERAFSDLRRFELRYGGIRTPRPEPLTAHALHFILQYLTNSIHGPLYQWLREEKGWVYEVGSRCSYDDKSLDWMLYFPLASREQVTAVRTELPGRIAAALANAEAVSTEVSRLGDHVDAFSYLTLAPIVRDAAGCLEDFGYIIPEVQMRRNLEKMRDVAFLQRVWEEHSTPDCTGCFCAVPLSS